MSVPQPSEQQGTQAPAPEESTHVRSTNGMWVLKPASAPVFQLSSHVLANLHSSEHFFVPVSLSFPNRKSVKTYALVDLGGTASCISQEFANRHSLSRRLKDEPVPITAVDDRPIASGLVTQDVITSLFVKSHAENITLAVVSISFPVILGLDWLRRHNPGIDWARNCLTLTCCGANPSYPVSALGKGFGLAQLSPFSSSLQSLSTTCIGLGLGLNGAILTPSRPDVIQRSDRARHPPLARNTYLSAATSSPLLPSTSIGFGQTGTFSSVWNKIISSFLPSKAVPPPPFA